MENFRIGDIVKLNSGSPQMTVSRVEEPIITCRWYNSDGNSIDTVKINKGALRKINV
ncbi:DUF2158 domain-containing protein [Aquimarina agarivorans]|uniref:DUF2158 domain-containing protein n=1 Tax=Aquimarina agarivorans TaxID=980584 RepID=UPI000248E70C